MLKFLFLIFISVGVVASKKLRRGVSANVPTAHPSQSTHPTPYSKTRSPTPDALHPTLTPTEVTEYDNDETVAMVRY